MTMQIIRFKDINDDNPYSTYFISLKEETYIFTVRWNNYASCAFLSIADYNNNPIISGKALVNGLKIRNKNLPYIFAFLHKTSETYEPTIDNLASEFMLMYDDEVEIS